MVVAEIGMNVEETSPAGLVQAATLEAGVGNKPGNAGQPREPGNEFRRIQFIGHSSQAGRKQFACRGLNRKLPLRWLCHGNG